MASEFYIIIFLAFIPITLGVLGKALRMSFSVLQPLGLTVIALEAGALVYLGFEVAPSLIHLTAVMLLAGFCALLGQRDFKFSTNTFTSIMIGLGLSLGVLLSQAPINRLFLGGFLGYAAIFLLGSSRPTLLMKLALVHLAIASISSFTSVFMGNPFSIFSGYLLAVTLLPLVPFHQPFLAIVGNSPGTLSGFWVVVIFSLGLSELHGLQTTMHPGLFFVFQWLALGSALYASIKCLGQNQIRPLIAYATVALSALLWGLTDVFLNFSPWAIPFGTTVALVMSGLLVGFSFVQHRFGWHFLGTFPGLWSPMPRFGTFLVLLITLAMLLPVFPTFSGLTTMPTFTQQDTSLFPVLVIFFTVWLAGSWYFSNLLHQTAFGKPRPDILYTDLYPAEMVTLALLIVGACLSGLTY